MTILKDVFAELFKMFLGDMRLSAAIFAVVAVAAMLIRLAEMPMLGGAVLLLGSFGVVIGAVRGEARRRRS